MTEDEIQIWQVENARLLSEVCNLVSDISGSGQDRYKNLITRFALGKFMTEHFTDATRHTKGNPMRMDLDIFYNQITEASGISKGRLDEAFDVYRFYNGEPVDDASWSAHVNAMREFRSPYDLPKARQALRSTSGFGDTINQEGNNGSSTIIRNLESNVEELTQRVQNIEDRLSNIEGLS